VSLEAMIAGDEPAAVSETSTVIAHAAATPAATPQPSKLYKKATVYLLKAALRRLKLMGIEHNRPINNFLQDGVELMLAKYGQPSLKEFERL
jgi:hypothetical protein